MRVSPAWGKTDGVLGLGTAVFRLYGNILLKKGVIDHEGKTVIFVQGQSSTKKRKVAEERTAAAAAGGAKNTQ